MSQLKVDTITDEAGTGSPNFPNGIPGTASDATQNQATWEAGTSTTESIVSPAKVKAAIEALGGGGVTVDYQVFTSSGTYTPPAGLLYAEVIVTGGGGGGGGARGSSDTTGFGGSGGGGGTVIAVLSASDIGSSAAVVVGAGGTSGSNADGTTGGTSSFTGNVVLTATGGIRGTRGNVGTGTNGDGGLGSASSGTHVPIYGQGGVQFGDGRSGGASYFGAGGAVVGGLSARNFGGGGCNAISSSSSNATGGFGKHGIVIVKGYVA